MKYIFWGFIFIFINFSFKFNGSSIDVLPDFIGYILVINGLNEMMSKSILFAKAKPISIVMLIISSLIFVTDLLGITATLGSLNYLRLIVCAILYLYMTYNIVMGVKDLEGKFLIHLDGDALKSNWTFFTIFYVLSIILALVPLLNIVLLIVGFIANICFLIAFNNSKNQYYNSYT